MLMLKRLKKKSWLLQGGLLFAFSISVSWAVIRYGCQCLARHWSLLTLYVKRKALKKFLNIRFNSPLDDERLHKSQRFYIRKVNDHYGCEGTIITAHDLP